MYSIESSGFVANCLKTLPGEVGQLKSLQTLNVKDNPRLTAVPPDLCRVRTLENLVVDVENMAFPPKGHYFHQSPHKSAYFILEIVAQGLEKTMKFLCDGASSYSKRIFSLDFLSSM